MLKIKTYVPISDYHLAKVKIAAFASEETLCFQATIMKGRLLVATTSNSGHGGCDNIRFTNKELEIEYKAAAAALWPDFAKYGADEVLTSELMSEFEAKKHAKKWFTFIKGDSKVSQFRFLSVGKKKVPHNAPLLKGWLKENGSDITLVSENHWANQEVVAK